jgi:hypothetical protein
MPRLRKALTLLLVLAFLAPVAVRAAVWYADDERAASWSSANWSSAGLLPPAAADPQARVLVMAGRTGGWRGIFAVHSWIVIKPAGASTWTRYDVVGWGTPLRTNIRPPDGRWYGNMPTIVADISGPEAAALIPRIEAAVAAYQHRDSGDYRAWPGPNSNTFVQTVLRAVPDAGIALPPHAIGKDYRADGSIAGWTASGTGFEIAAGGMLGLKAGWVEGIEINLLGLVAGIDIRRPALKLPGFGRIGMAG